MGLYLVKQKKVLKKVLVGAGLFLIGAIFLFFIYQIGNFYHRPSWLMHPLFPAFVMTVIALAAYKPLDAAMTRFFRHYLFKQKTYAQMTLSNLADELALILDLSELSNLVVNTFGEVLHLKTVALLVPNRLRGDYEIASAFGWSVSDARRVRFSEDSPMIKWLQDCGPHVVVRDVVSRCLSWQESNRIQQDFDQLRANWIIPLFIKEEFVGSLAFAAASPDFKFDESDFHFFRQFAAPVATALRNALAVLELKIANEELQDVQSQLLQTTKISAIEQLATGIAHEIHNPLTIISGKAQVLLLQKERNRLDERVEEVLKTIVKQTKRAADITRKLLMFSQSSGSPKEWLRLEQVLEDTIALVSYQTSLEGIEISRSLGAGIPSFYANVHEMREVFLNLVLNGVQSVGAKGKIHCEVHYKAPDQIIEISVSDSGKGIPPENIEKLFNPFFTTRPDAVGLGLFVTKQIVHRYGGSIRVESRPEEGSLFRVQLPIFESYGAASEKNATLSLFPDTEASQSKRV